MTRIKLLALLAITALVASACTTGGAAQDEDRLSVVVTTTVWGDVVSNVTGDDANVEVLFPIGADPHDYQLSAAQAASMEQADLVVVNGLALEEGLLDVIEGLEADGANVLEVAALLDPIPFGEGGHAHEEEGEHSEEEKECDPEAGHEEHAEEEGEHAEEHGHDEGSCDPHIWMDPLRVAMAVELIADELTALDDSIDWSTRAGAYADELRELDSEVVSLLSEILDDRRKLVTNHEAFGYFSDRYGFELVGTVIPGGATLADPSSAELSELVEILTDEEIDVVFAETIEPSALADAVAGEVGTVTVVELFTGSLGGPDSGAESYIDLIRTNAERIAGALS